MFSCFARDIHIIYFMTFLSVGFGQVALQIPRYVPSMSRSYSFPVEGEIAAAAAVRTTRALAKKFSDQRF